MRRLVGAWIVVCGFASPALAENAASCAASFPERLADAKRAVVQHDKLAAEHAKKNGKKDAATAQKMAWFDAHCRFLSPLEIAIRKLDDPNAFVCDTAKGRPKGLTTAFVLQAMGDDSVPSVSDLQAHYSMNGHCFEHDEKERIPLMVSDDLPFHRKLELLCYDDERPTCVEGRETLAKLRAAGKL